MLWLILGGGPRVRSLCVDDLYKIDDDKLSDFYRFAFRTPQDALSWLVRP